MEAKTQKHKREEDHPAPTAWRVYATAAAAATAAFISFFFIPYFRLVVPVLIW